MTFLADADPTGFLGTVWKLINEYPDVVIVTLFILCGVGLPVPEEPILLMAGAMAEEAASGETSGMGIQLLRFSSVSAVGILLGDLACFHLGRVLGPGILRWRWIGRIATRRRRVRAEQFFKKYGAWAIFLARFFAGVRLVMYFSAGVSRRVSYWRFLFMDFLGVLVSVPISVYVGYVVYHELKQADFLKGASERLGVFHVVLLAAIVVGIAVWLLVVRKGRASDRRDREREARQRGATAEPPGPAP